MSRYLTPLALLFASACASGDAALETRDTDPQADDTGSTDYEGTLFYRVDVIPSGSVDDADGQQLDLQPQTFVMEAEVARTLVLERPVTVQGSVTGYLVSPSLYGELPGSIENIDSTVSFRRPESLQHRTTFSDFESGVYSMLLPPDPDYVASIVPNDPMVPFTTFDIAISEDLILDIDLGVGVAVWGRVVDDQDNPLSGVEVFAEDVAGTQGASAFTGVDGWYQLRVDPGPYTLVAAGRDNGRDPTLRSDQLFVGEEGLSYDFAYENLDLVAVNGRMRAASGADISDGIARFTARNLDGYPGNAELVIEAEANSVGNFDTLLLAGTWDVELFPTDDQATSPVRLDAVQITGATDLSTTTLPLVVDSLGTVVDAEGLGVSGALVQCTEVGYAERSFLTTTGEDGRFTLLDVPQTSLECVLTPPGHRNDLATTLSVVEPSIDDGVTQSHDAGPLYFDTGVRLLGRVRASTGSEVQDLGFAIIEVRDTKGRLLGSTLSSAETGEFELRVAWFQ